MQLAFRGCIEGAPFAFPPTAARKQNMNRSARRQILVRGATALALLSTGALTAHAQTAAAYPSKPIRLVVPQAAGGGSDTIARFVADKLSTALGQTVVVDNKPGAAGMLGAELVKTAPPDGYTMLLSAIDTITAPLVSTRKPFDGVRDFAPITQLAQSHNVWLVGPGFEGKTLRDLVTRAKAAPGKIDYASSGVGSMQHLAGELLEKMAAIDLAHIPYKGGPPAFTDVVGGRVPVMVSGMQGAVPQIKADKVRPLAVTGRKRSPVLPDVPTVGEALGLPDYEAMNWQGLLFPAGTPQPVVERVASEVVKILAQADTREKLAQMGYEPIGNTPAQAAAVMAEEQRRWSAIIKASNITSD
jgi:tripartite-type tricarboxylate transporter receptor subunit TctC